MGRLWFDVSSCWIVLAVQLSWVEVFLVIYPFLYSSWCTALVVASLVRWTSVSSHGPLRSQLKHQAQPDATRSFGTRSQAQLDSLLFSPSALNVAWPSSS